MKFSLNLAQYYSDLDFKGLDRAEIVERIGLQLGAVEDAEDWKPKYQGVVVVRVVSCNQHPEADKLKLCLVDDGGVVQNVERDNDGLVQVVCGAQNVRADMLAAWIPPGTAVPQSYETESEPFILSAKEIRGKVSNGMLGSPRELALSDEHGGILDITSAEAGDEVQLGEPFANYFGVDDFVVDCENKMFTHRPDCFGNLGIARELAGIFGLNYTSPDWYTNVPAIDEYESTQSIELDVTNPIEQNIPRFMTVALENVEVGPSPQWMQGYLRRVGIKPINNVVDVTNYVMHLLGQPMHAFDYDKLLTVAGADDSQVLPFGPRMARKDEKVILLGDKEVVLSENDMVITAGGQPVALGGVMGGRDTEVDESTTRVVLECATFDMYAIRRTSMRYGLFTDAVTRYNKGQSPLQNDRAVWYALKLLQDFAGAQRASDVHDIASFDPNGDNLNRVETTAQFINERLGTTLKPPEIKKLLESVECVVWVEGENIGVTVPFWRMDIVIAEDIVEEVGRLYGYDKLPVSLPPRQSAPPTKNTIRVFRQRLRSELSKAGANEVLTYSFVHGDLLQSVGIDPATWAYHVRNAISPDLQYYRPTLLPSLLSKVHGNIKAGADGTDTNEFALFELGKAHVKKHMEDEESQLPKQMRRLAFVFVSDDKSAKKHCGSAYYSAKKYLDAITRGQALYEPLEDMSYPITSAYQKGRSAVVKINDQVLGVIGEFHSKAQSALKLPGYCAGFELDTDMLLEQLEEKKYQKLSHYPGSAQDITLEVSSDVSWGHVYDFVHAEVAVGAAEDHFEYSVEPLDIYQAQNSDKVRISFRVHMASYRKTLRTEEVNALLDHIEKQAVKSLNARRI